MLEFVIKFAHNFICLRNIISGMSQKTARMKSNSCGQWAAPAHRRILAGCGGVLCDVSF